MMLVRKGCSFIIGLYCIVLGIGQGVAQTFNPFPGKVVFETNDPIKKRVASPSILILSNGDYLVSHDYNKGTSIHISKDKGETWSPLSHVDKIIWANLFDHQGNIYLMGTSKGWGNMVISQSKDNGKTWSSPQDENTGLLAEGMFHTGPVPIVKHNGKIWRAYEEVFDEKKRRDFYAFVICADEHADLLKASSWKRTNSIQFDKTWLNARRPNWFEGNMVVTPEGKLVDFMRLQSWSAKGINYEIEGTASGIPRNEIAALIDVDEKNMEITFRSESRNFVHFPGAESKFTIRYDSVSKLYWTITNQITSFTSSFETYDGNWNQRNVMILMSSKDLKKWDIRKKILKWNEGAQLKTWDTFGFQYADWQIERDDIVFVSRTSWYGLRYHDANMITFHRIADFRTTRGDREPEDWVKYTQHPTLIRIRPFDRITNQEGLDVKIILGDGMRQLDNGHFRFALEPMPTKKEKAALKLGRYIDFNISTGTGRDFSVETLHYLPKINRKDIQLRWMYSVDGTSFHPITRYAFPLVVEQPDYVKNDPPLYLKVYDDLHQINGKTGVLLRCYIIGGNKTGTTLSFIDDIVIGGRVLSE